MASLEVLLEAEKRGILPGDKVELLAEARRRGLVPNTDDTPLNSYGLTHDVSFTPSEVAGYAPPVLATVGGIGGATIGGMPGAVAGAALGGAAGKAIEQKIKGKPLDPKEIAYSGAEQGAYELGGGVLAKGLSKVAAPLAARLNPEVEGLVRYFRKFGGEFTPAQRTENYLVDSAEKVAEGSLFGGNQILHHKLGLKRASDLAIDDLTSRVGTKLTPEEAGTLLTDAISGKFELFRETSSKMYSNVDTLVGKAKVDLTQIKAFAKERQFIAESRKGIGSTAAGDTLLDKVGKLDDTITFEQAQSLRSAFHDELQSAQISKDKAAGIAKKFLSLTDQSMEKAATNIGPEALDAWRAANKFYRDGKGLLRSKFVSKMVQKDPELAVRYIFQPGKVSQIRNVKNIVGEDSSAWENMKGSYLESIVRDATGVETAEVSGKKLVAVLNKMGDPALKTIFTPKELSDIRMVAGIKNVLQKDTGGGGKMLVQIAQGGAIVSLATGAYPKAGTTILLGPYALGKLLLSKTGSKWLTEGFKIPANSGRAIAVSERIIAEAIRETGGKEISFPGGFDGS